MARGGMVQLAHTDNSLGNGSFSQVGEADPPMDGATSFLKMDGAVVRYQAFEVAPLTVADDSSLPSSTGIDLKSSQNNRRT